MKKNIQDFPSPGRYISRNRPGRWRHIVRSQRFLTTLLGVSLFWSVEAPGLGLGDIELNSYLNQPLSAEITLLSVDPNEVDQITIKLADQAAYDAAGIERFNLLEDLIFTVQQDAEGNVEILVSTKANIKEPFLDFIVDVSWPSGQVMRQYTLLLDPPVFTSQQSGAVAAPEIGFTIQADSAAANQQSAAPASTSVSQSSSVTTTSSQAAPASPRTLRQPSNVDPLSRPAPEGQIRVQRRETLWNVAERVHPNAGFSIEQRMIGIYRNNPEAFMSSNINNLKAGYVLRVPSEEMVAELSKSEAAQASRQHYRDWLNAKRLGASNTNQVAKTTPGPASLADGIVSNKGASSSEGRLSIVSPDSTRGDAARASSGGDLQGLSSGDLALVLEQAKNSQAESEALKSRITALEEQLAMMERLITLKDDALVEMQRQLGDQPDQAALPGALGGAEEQDQAVVSDAPVEVLPETKEVGVTEGEVAPVVKKAPKPAPVQAVEETADESGLIEMLLNPQILMLGVGVLLLIAAAILVVRKRRESAEDFEFHDFQPEFDQLDTEGGENVTVAVEQTGAEKPEENMSFPELSEEAFADLPEAEELGGSSLESFQADEVDIDPIAEADVYLAYRRFQQAEELIKEAMQRHPERHDLQAKLLEIYFAAGNTAGFEAQAEALFAELGGQVDDTWKSVAEMGRELCPEHPLFGGSGTVVEEAVVEEDMAVNEVIQEMADEQAISDIDELDVDSLADLTNLEEVDSQSIEEALDFSDIDLSGEAVDETAMDDLSGLDLDFSVDDAAEQVSDADALVESVENESIAAAEVEESTLDELTDGLDSVAEVAEDVDLDLSGPENDLSEESPSFDFDEMAQQTEQLDDEVIAESDFDMDASSVSEENVSDVEVSLDAEENVVALEQEDKLSFDESQVELEAQAVELDQVSEDMNPLEDGLIDEVDEASAEMAVASETDVDDMSSEVDLSSLSFEALGAEEAGGVENEPDGIAAANDGANLDFDSLGEEVDAVAMTEELDDAVAQIDESPLEDFDFTDSSDEMMAETEVASDQSEDLLASFDDIEENPLGEVAVSTEDAVADSDAAQQESEDLLASFEEEGDNVIEELSQNYGELDEVFTGLADSELGSGDDDLFAGADMIGTKLDLARAYIDMEDHEGARGILEEVLEEGSDVQKQEAEEMMRKIG